MSSLLEQFLEGALLWSVLLNSSTELTTDGIPDKPAPNTDSQFWGPGLPLLTEAQLRLLIWAYVRMEEQKGRFSLGLFSSGETVGPGNGYLARL